MIDNTLISLATIKEYAIKYMSYTEKELDSFTNYELFDSFDELRKEDFIEWCK